MKVQIKGLKELERKIESAKKKLGLTAGEFADKSAQVLRDTVVRNAQPFGSGNAAKEKGEKAIMSDLHKAFKVVSNSAAGKKVISNLGAAVSYHKSRRNARGRVSSGERKPITAAVFGALYNKLKERVGMAKGSVSGEGKLNSKAPKWVKRHETTGDAKRRRMLSGAEWTFRANPPHVASSKVLGEVGVNRAISKNRSNLKRTLERDIARKLKQEEKRINRGKG